MSDLVLIQELSTFVQLRFARAIDRKSDGEQAGEFGILNLGWILFFFFFFWSRGNFSGEMLYLWR